MSYKFENTIIAGDGYAVLPSGLVFDEGDLACVRVSHGDQIVGFPIWGPRDVTLDTDRFTWDSRWPIKSGDELYVVCWPPSPIVADGGGQSAGTGQSQTAATGCQRTRHEQLFQRVASPVLSHWHGQDGLEYWPAGVTESPLLLRGIVGPESTVRNDEQHGRDEERVRTVQISAVEGSPDGWILEPWLNAALTVCGVQYAITDVTMCGLFASLKLKRDEAVQVSGRLFGGSL